MRAPALVLVVLAIGCDYHGRDFGVADAGDDGVTDAPVPPIDGAGDIDAAIVMIDASPPDAGVADAGPPDAPVPPGCPVDYAPIDDAPPTSRYRIIAGFENWGPAEIDCDDDGAGTHLVVVDDAAESAALDAVFFGDFWLGASDRVTEGTFLSVTGGPAPYLDWGFLQPDDFFGQDCVGLDEGGAYSDRDCGASRGYICECDGLEPDPAAF